MGAAAVASVTAMLASVFIVAGTGASEQYIAVVCRIVLLVICGVFLAYSCYRMMETCHNLTDSEEDQAFNLKRFAVVLLVGQSLCMMVAALIQTIDLSQRVTDNFQSWRYIVEMSVLIGLEGCIYMFDGDPSQYESAEQSDSSPKSQRAPPRAENATTDSPQFEIGHPDEELETALTGPEHLEPLDLGAPRDGMPSTTHPDLTRITSS